MHNPAKVFEAKGSKAKRMVILSPALPYINDVFPLCNIRQTAAKFIARFSQNVYVIFTISQQFFLKVEDAGTLSSVPFEEFLTSCRFHLIERKEFGPRHRSYKIVIFGSIEKMREAAFAYPLKIKYNCIFARGYVRKFKLLITRILPVSIETILAPL